MIVLMSHVQVVLDYQFTSTDDMLTYTKLLISTALFNLSKSEYQQISDKCERSLKIRKNLLSPDHFETLENIQTLGETFLYIREFGTAKTLLQRTIVEREKNLGPLHVDILDSLSDITITYLELDDLESTETTDRKVLEKREKVLGLDNPEYLVSLNIMAI